MEVKNILEITSEVFKSKNNETDYGVVGNGILYDACKKYPNHNNKSEIIAKTWLIGRSYAVSLERTKNNGKDREISDDFYKNVADKFIARKFDEDLLELKNERKIRKENIPKILRVHKELVRFINEKITLDNRRSFVSKYLHFHFKNLFFIYDSRVAGLLQEKVLKSNFRYNKKCYEKILKSQDYDNQYADFFVKCFFLQNYLKKNGLYLTPRELDNCLIKIANDITRNKPQKKKL